MKFGQILWKVFTACNLILFVFYCTCWLLPESKRNNFENVLCKLRLVVFPEGYNTLGVVVMSLLSSLVSFFLWLLVADNRRKLRIFYPLCNQLLPLLFSRRQVCDQLSPFVKVCLSVILHAKVKHILQRFFSTFNKYSFILTLFRESLFYFSFAKFFTLLSRFCFFIKSEFFGSNVFCN